MILELALLTFSSALHVRTFKMETLFEVKGELFVEYDSANIARSRHYALIYRNQNGETKTITQLGQLTNHVSIKNQSEALSFARIYGSPLTSGCRLDKKVLEVSKKSLFTLDHVFGNKEIFSDCLKSPNMSGIVDGELLKTEAIQPAIVLSEKGHWVIRRSFVFIENNNHLMLEDVSEKVWPDGRYNCRVVNRRAPRSKRWVIGYVS